MFLPAFKSGAGIRFDYIWWIDADVKAKDQSHAHSFHLHHSISNAQGIDHRFRSLDFLGVERYRYLPFERITYTVYIGLGFMFEIAWSMCWVTACK